jgi:hypothetical protein
MFDILNDPEPEEVKVVDNDDNINFDWQLIS